MEQKTKRHSKRKSKQDSFAKRRKVFKNVWDTALDMEDKTEQNRGKKPKVIKTLRLTEMDSIYIGKNKKQRIKYLRNVCTRLLDFCNRHDAEETYELMNAGSPGNDADIEESNHNTDNVIPPQCNTKQKKRRRKKKKLQGVYTYVTLPIGQSKQKRYRSSFGSKEDGPITHRGTKPLRNASSWRLDRSTLIKQYADERHNLENAVVPFTPAIIPDNDPVGDVRRKVVKKKHHKIRRPALKPVPAKVSNQTKRSSGSKKSSITKKKHP